MDPEIETVNQNIVPGAAGAETTAAETTQAGTTESKQTVETSALTPAVLAMLLEKASKFDEHQKTLATEAATKEQQRLAELAKQGNVDEAFRQYRESLDSKLVEEQTRYSNLEKQVFDEKKAGVIGEAIGARQLRGETPEQRTVVAKQLRMLLENDFEAVRDHAGAVVVREKITGRSAAEVLKERLDSADFAVFLAPKRQPANPGGFNPQTAPGFVHEVDANTARIAQEWRARGGSSGMGLGPIGPR